MLSLDTMILIVMVTIDFVWFMLTLRKPRPPVSQAAQTAQLLQLTNELQTDALLQQKEIKSIKIRWKPRSTDTPGSVPILKIRYFGGS